MGLRDRRVCAVRAVIRSVLDGMHRCCKGGFWCAFLTEHQAYRDVQLQVCLRRRKNAPDGASFL